MKTVRHVALWLACVAACFFLAPLAHAQSVSTYTQSSTGNTVNAQGVTSVPRYSANPIDCGGTITAGGTSQVASAANLTRTYLYVQNPISATEPLTIRFGSAAPLAGAGNAYELAPGGTFTLQGDSSSMFTGSVNVNATTTAHRFVCFTN